MNFMVILRAWAMEALRDTPEPGVDGSSEHGAGALIQEKHDVSNTSESTLIPCVGRHETSCLSAECNSLLGVDEIWGWWGRDEKIEEKLFRRK